MNFKNWLLSEDFEQWTGRWIHYSEQPFMKLHYSSIWSDPLGIYFFPEKFENKTTGGWHMKPFKFIVTFPTDMKVLDLSNLDLSSRIKILKQAMEYTNNKTDVVEKVKENPSYFWSYLKDVFNLIGGRSGGPKAKMTSFLMKELKYDAIFDDTNEIYSGEVQLILINPKIKYKVIDVVRRSGSGWNEVEIVAKRVSELCKPFGLIKIGKQEQRFSGWDHENRVTVTLNVNEHLHREGPYAHWEISSQRESSGKPDEIVAHLKYSNPRGPGNTTEKQFWEKSFSEDYNYAVTTITTRTMDLSALDVNVPAIMTKIWDRHNELKSSATR